MAERVAKEAKRVNTELSNSNSRISALPKLKRLLSHKNETILSENILNWIQTLCQLITFEHNALAGEVFTVALSQACQVPSISRDISTKFIPGVLDDFLKIPDKDIVTLSAVEAILEYYPTSCGNLRTHVVKTMLALMMSSEDEDILNSAARCWSLGSFLGGGGHQRSNHSTQWLNQFMDCVPAMKFALDCFLGDDEGKIDSSIGSYSMTFPFLPKEEPEHSDAIIKRISIICRCLLSLVRVEFPLPLPFPVDTILRIILQILDIVPSQMGSTTEMTYRAEQLPLIHEDVLQVLEALTKICRRNLCRYSFDINNTFSALLDLWKDKTPTHGCNKKHSIIREKVYNAMANWLQNCGATTRFMCGQTILNRNLLRHIIDDVKPVTGAAVVTNKLSSGGGSKKAKRRRMIEVTDLMNGNQVEQIIDQTANQFLTSAALKVVVATIDTMCHRLSEEVVQSFQSEIISLLLRLQTSEDIIPYHRCAQPRLMLYKALLSFVLSPSEFVPPPIEIAVRIFTSAISQENNSNIRLLCNNGISSFSNIVHPWRHAWHLCVPTKSVESPEINGSVPFLEPMNVVDEEDMDDIESGQEPEEHCDVVTTPSPHRVSSISNRAEIDEKRETETDETTENKENIAQINNRTENGGFKSHLAETIETENHIATIKSHLEDSDISTKPTEQLKIKEKPMKICEQKSPEITSSPTYINKRMSSSAQDETEKSDDDELKDMMNDFVDASPDHE